MRRLFQLFPISGLALMCCVAAARATAAESDSPVLAQDLPQLRASGKVLAVLWTRRSDHCTLQVVLPPASDLPPVTGLSADTLARLRDLAPSFGAATTSLRKAAQKTSPEIRVWLLGTNGAVITPTRVTRPAGSANSPGPEMLYAFPLSAAEDAVAAAISVDGEFHIERLAPFPEQSPGE